MSLSNDKCIFKNFHNLSIPAVESPLLGCSRISVTKRAGSVKVSVTNGFSVRYAQMGFSCCHPVHPRCGKLLKDVVGRLSEIHNPRHHHRRRGILQ